MKISAVLQGYFRKPWGYFCKPWGGCTSPVGRAETSRELNKTRRGLNRIEAWADNLVAPVIHRIRSPNNNSSSLPFLANIAAVVYNSSNISLLLYSLGFHSVLPFIHRRFRVFSTALFPLVLYTINH